MQANHLRTQLLGEAEASHLQGSLEFKHINVARTVCVHLLEKLPELGIVLLRCLHADEVKCFRGSTLLLRHPTVSVKLHTVYSRIPPHIIITRQRIWC